MTKKDFYSLNIGQILKMNNEQGKIIYLSDIPGEAKIVKLDNGLMFSWDDCYEKVLTL